MSKLGIAIDVNKCIGCYNCFLTCRDEFAGNDYPGYSAPQPMSGGNWMKVKEIERGTYPHVKVNHVPMTCNHCESAACIKLDQTGAVYRRPDGIVMIDPVKAKGNKDLVNTCPYRKIEWNEELAQPQKCTMCAHLLDAGNKEPRCVESCPSGALTFGDMDDLNSAISKLLASGGFGPLKDEYGMREKVVYRNLPRKFVAGLVIYDDKNEVADGIKVVLTGSEGEQTTVTNGFGDFEFEGLPENTSFTVKIQVPEYKEATLPAKTSRDVYLGEIKLVR